MSTPQFLNEAVRIPGKGPSVTDAAGEKAVGHLPKRQNHLDTMGKNDEPSLFVNSTVVGCGPPACRNRPCGPTGSAKALGNNAQRR